MIYKEKTTIKDAARQWVDGFNAIPSSLIEKAYKNNIDDLVELTPITAGDYVWSNDFQGSFEVVSVNKEEETAKIEVDGEEKEVDLDDLFLEKDSWLPMWGWLWMFDKKIDDEWAMKNLDLLAECGFRIYEDQEDGHLFIGIDGAGYDFYESHWIPLYKARGLHWHDEE